MSAVRRKPNRSNRSALSSPYARPVKKSSWSFSGFLNYLLPLRRQDSTEEEEGLSSDEVDIDVDDEALEELPPPPPARTISRRGQQLDENVAPNGHAFPGPPSSQKLTQAQSASSIPLPTGLPSIDFTFQASSSASNNLDTVTRFLTTHANQPIAPEDINQMVALIQQSKPGVSPSLALSEDDVHESENEEPFRFETRAATSPPRSKSPSVQPRGSSAPRTLSRNPNGPYTWKGAGSARAHRSRNNFSSPAFRTPRFPVARSSTSGDSGNDAKRRRVGDSATEAPTSQTTSNLLQPPPAAAPIRQRTPGLQKPTTPVVPSPLRQAWTGGSPSGSESSSPQGPNTLRQTETAKHVTELVNSLRSQDKVLDELRNPYEAANPVKRSTAPKRKRVAALAKKPTMATPPKEDSATKVKIKEMSAHAIIEATLPEGSKRSRPPADLKKSAAGSKEPLKVTIEAEEAEEIRVAKRHKPQANGHTSKEAPDVEMQSNQSAAKDKKEKLPPIKVPVMPAASSQPSSSTKSLFGPKSSMPKEPSKLRFSMQPESTSTPPSPVPEPKAQIDEAPKPTSTGLTFSPTSAPAPAAPETEKEEITPATNFFSAFVPPPAPSPTPPAPTFTPTPASATTSRSARDMAKSQPLTSLPVFTFTFPISSTFGESKARDEAKAISTASLPTFDLTKSVAPPASSSKGGFDWGAAGMKLPTTTNGGEWTCSGCMLKNPASATVKCTICDALKADGNAEASKPAPSFNWAAAGMKPAPASSTDEWVCSQCNLKNPVSATAKCTICDAPKPGGAAATEPPRPPPSFNWGAAGIKPTAPAVDGEWVCNQCSLKNPATAANKCGICDAPKPSGSTDSAPNATGFNWTAAGMRAPTSTGASEWTCGLCGLKNPATATAKCTICDAVRS